jgi:hypothetical protein
MRRTLAVILTVATSGFTWGGAAVVTAGAAAAATPQIGGPLIRVHSTKGTTPVVFENWSGYAATPTKPDQTFTYVHTQFVQPAITCVGKPYQWTSNWVGLDGFNDETVEQDGTWAHCGGPTDETAMYSAWYEMYPANSHNVFNVRPGDVIDELVSYSTTTSNYTLTVSDLTTGKSATDTAQCASCARASAEWVIERPAECISNTDCFILALADYGTTTMSSDIAQSTAFHAAQPVSSFPNNYAMDMVQPLKSGGFISLDTVGAYSPATDAFTATWDRSGSTVPITLAPKSSSTGLLNTRS